MTTHLAQSFPPIATKQSKILILGSVPGLPSLKKQEYYGNDRNAFWRIIARLFDDSLNKNFDTYQNKISTLTKNDIALWDVLKQCTRTGSLDSKIDNSSIITNDFNVFLSKHHDIQHIFFNGTKAEIDFKKHVQKTLNDQSLTYTRLPSTSPAMAHLNFEQKLDAWSIIKATLHF